MWNAAWQHHNFNVNGILDRHVELNTIINVLKHDCDIQRDWPELIIALCQTDTYRVHQKHSSKGWSCDIYLSNIQIDISDKGNNNYLIYVDLFLNDYVNASGFAVVIDTGLKIKRSKYEPYPF